MSDLDDDDNNFWGSITSHFMSLGYGGLTFKDLNKSYDNKLMHDERKLDMLYPFPLWLIKWRKSKFSIF